MEKVIFGATKEEVSALCLGTDHYGSGTNTETAHSLLDYYYEAGGRFIDTANCYAFWAPGCSGGESEITIGKWIKARGNRDELFIGTKVGGGLEEKMGLSAAQIEQECHRSLRRLGIDTIDLYYAHLDDRSKPHEEVLEAFDRLVQAGKVRHIAASNHKSWRLAEARIVSQNNRWATYCAVEQRYTYLKPKSNMDSDGYLIEVDEDLLEYCEINNLPILAYSVLLRGGAYTRLDRAIPDRYNGLETEARLELLRAIASEVRGTVNQVVLAWLRQQNQPRIIPIIGASTIEQLSENLGSLNINLAAEQIDRLNKGRA